MKRILTAALVSLVMILGLAAVLPETAKADPPSYSSGDYAYTLDGSGNATIIVYSGTGGDITIPDSFPDASQPQNPYPVTEIAATAFENNTSITGVIIPDTVKTLDDDVFEGCSQLASVTLSTGLSEIPQHAFQGTALTSVTIPEGVTAIDFNAFNSITTLQTVSLPSTLTTVGDDAFCGCQGLSSINLPGSVTSLGTDAFGDCDNLSSVTFSDGTQPLTIGDTAFYQSKLTEITLPSRLASLGNNVFNPCATLQKVVILSKTVTFGTGVFNSTDLNGDPAYGIYGYAGSSVQAYAAGHTLGGNPINFHAGFLMSFNSNGGSAIASSFIETGSTIAKPTNPVKANNAFMGWYKESGLVNQWNFNTDTVTADTVLYAKWVPATAYLSGVSLSAGKLSRTFSKTIYSYTINLGENVSSVTITPVKQYDGAVMTINNASLASYPVSLANGKSKIVKVKVAYAGKSHVYTFTVKRAKSTNDNLATLSVSAGTLSQPFDPAVKNYIVYLDENTKAVTITDTVAAPGLAKAAFSAKTVKLLPGQKTIVKLKVKAQSGASKTYIITVKRAASTDASLLSIKAGSFALVPAFDKGTPTYNVTLSPSSGSVTITVKAEGYKAVVRIDGKVRTSEKVTLAPGGSKTVKIFVTAQAGGIPKEYDVTISRP